MFDVVESELMLSHGVDLDVIVEEEVVQPVGTVEGVDQSKSETERRFFDSLQKNRVVGRMYGESSLFCYPPGMFAGGLPIGVLSGREMIDCSSFETIQPASPADVAFGRESRSAFAPHSDDGGRVVMPPGTSAGATTPMTFEHPLTDVGVIEGVELSGMDSREHAEILHRG